MNYVKCCVAPPLAGLLLFSASQAVAGDPETFCVDTYVGVNATYNAAREAFVDRYELLTGVVAEAEGFESYAGGQEVGGMPANEGRFAPEYADGTEAPLPIIQATIAAPFGSRWTQNFGNGRPFGASWVVRPKNEGESIYAFAQTNAQGDWVRILGYNDEDELIVSIDASNTGTAFVGFVSRTPIAKVVITPLGNGDFANGMDEVFVETTPLPDCADVTYDGNVDLADLNAVLASFGTENGCGDVNGDGFVDLADLNLVLAGFNSNCF